MSRPALAMYSAISSDPASSANMYAELSPAEFQIRAKTSNDTEKNVRTTTREYLPILASTDKV